MKQIVDVLHVLGVTKNMLYAGAIIDMGCVVVFSATKCWVMTFQEPRKVVVVGTRDCDSGFYKLEVFKQRNMFMAKRIMPLKVWHKQFGHLNFHSLRQLSKYGAMHGIPKFSTLTQNEVCGGYMTRKQTKEEISKICCHMNDNT
jgi:hypothetical protein